MSADASAWKVADAFEGLPTLPEDAPAMDMAPIPLAAQEHRATGDFIAWCRQPAKGAGTLLLTSPHEWYFPPKVENVLPANPAKSMPYEVCLGGAAQRFIYNHTRLVVGASSSAQV
eukprot:SAG11_NODE_498_length_8940_cov_11.447121_11_plen_116_part_00